jgi:acetyltransferase-like isoleucine patch superfamily enzyme
MKKIYAQRLCTKKGYKFYEDSRKILATGFFNFWDKFANLINKYRVLHILNKCSSVGTEVGLRMPVTVCHPQGLKMGNQISIGEYTHIRAKGGVNIGDRVLIASHVIITSQGHPKSLPRYGITLEGPIHIEDDVWIAANAVILPNTRIGKGSIVAAGAVLSKNVPPYSIAAGVPARIIEKIPHGTYHREKII